MSETNISPALVKELREKTGAGMMDCKKALFETKGNLEDAIDWLRKKGLAAAAKKSSRVAAEGLVGLSTAGTSGAVVEVNAETDFVARNEQFQGFVQQVASVALQGKIQQADVLKNAPLGGSTVQETLTQLIATIGENMNLRRTVTLSVNQGVVAGYVHGQLIPGLGKIGVLVALESTAAPEALQSFGRQLAMHVAAANPAALNVADVDASALEREKDVLRAQAAASGKPVEIIEKMLEGRLRKYYEEVVLLEQLYIIDGESRVKDAIAAKAKELGAPITLTGFARFALGEGIEKEQEDFAAEVLKQAAL
ncbi:MAG: translation elongation factor Ts [Alphaproteobacteria bacterium]